MRRFKNRSLLFAICIIILCSLSACCPQGPRAVYGSFYKALEDHNAEVSWQLIDKASQQAFANTAIFLTQTGKGKVNNAKDAWKWAVEQNGASNLPDPYDFTDETIDGDYAVLTFNGSRVINLLREKGNWKVQAVNPGK
jgi:hypothetical protein